MTIRLSKKEPKKKVSKKRFIIWGRSGSTNPRCVFDDEKEVQKVASSMAAKHNSEFYVAELTKVFKPVVKSSKKVGSHVEQNVRCSDAYIPF